MTVDEKTEMPERGGKRDRAKTHVIYYATDDELRSNENAWKLDTVRGLATVNKPCDELRVLGGTFGGDA
eukprot:11161215-Lingulodinium_polyedra.AAC.1